MGQQRVGHDWETFTCTVFRLPRWLSGKESTYQYRRHKRCRFNSWVRKISWSRKWRPIPVFLPGKFHGQRSLVSRLQPMGSQRVRHDWSHTYDTQIFSLFPWYCFSIPGSHSAHHITFTHHIFFGSSCLGQFIRISIFWWPWQFWAVPIKNVPSLGFVCFSRD